MRRQLMRGLSAMLVGVVTSAAGVTGAQASPEKSHSQGTAGAVAAASPGPGSQLWAARYGTTEFENTANAVQVSPAGGTVYVTGTSAGTGSMEIDRATVAYHG